MAKLQPNIAVDVFQGRCCRKCAQKLTADNYNPPNFARKIYICRECDRRERRVRRQENPEKARAYQNRWRQQNPARAKANAAGDRQRNRSRLTARRRSYYLRNKEHVLNLRKDWSAKLKFEVFSHYCGGGPPKCRCGYSDLRALTIDHVAGGGSQHRREIKGGGARIYQWLRAHNYPIGYQVLCMNCQFVKKMENSEYRRSHAECSASSS